MKELELHHIAGYLPHGIHFTGDDGTETESFLLYQLTKEGHLNLYVDCDEFDIECHISEEKPILRPESDLTKPIRHKGYNNWEEFVPIVELAKAAWEIEASEWVSPVVIDGLSQCRTEQGLTFGFDSEFRSFISKMDHMDEIIMAPNQVKLFDLLNSWLIDYRGLIPAGLAKSVYGLKENPYE